MNKLERKTWADIDFWQKCVAVVGVLDADWSILDLRIQRLERELPMLSECDRSRKAMESAMQSDTAS